MNDLEQKSLPGSKSIGGGNRATRRYIACFVAIASACTFSFVGARMGHRWWVAGYENGLLHVEDRHLHLGEQWEDADFSWTLPITNRSSHDIHIERFLFSCNCTEVRPASISLKPGETRETRIKIDLGSVGWNSVTTSISRGDELDVRPFSIRIAPIIRDALPEFRGWTLRGNVRRPFAITPSRPNFGDTLIEGQAWQPISFRVDSTVPLKKLVATSDEPNLAQAVVRPGDSDRRHIVEVAPHSGADVGFRRFNITLHGDTLVEAMPPFHVPIEMEVLADVFTVPSQLVFRPIPLGETAKESIIINSRTGRRFEVMDVHVPAESGLSVEQQELKDGSVTLTIRQTGVALKSQAAEITIECRGGAGREIRSLHVPISYFGIEPFKDSRSSPWDLGEHRQ